MLVNTTPDSEHATAFEGFKLFIEQEVKPILKSMPTKSCELDLVPTSFLKDIQWISYLRNSHSTNGAI